MTDADPLTLACRAVRAALDTLRDAAFTGVLVITWVDGACRRVHWEGVGTVTPRGDPVRWSHAHSTAVQAVRTLAPALATGRIVVQLRAGVPVGTHCDTLD